MAGTRQSLVFFGSEEFSAPSLRLLIEQGWAIEAVVTRPDSRRGRSKQLVAPLVKQIAQEHSISTLQPKSKAELKELVAPLSSKLAVLVSYGMIIPQTVIDHFPLGIINVHPSKLPELRGPAPIEYTILEGSKELWVSIMKLDAGMDTGPVYVQEMQNIQDEVTGPQLSSQAAEFGAELLTRNLPEIASGVLKPINQDDFETNPTYSAMITKQMGILDPFNKRAEQLEREIRAYLGWPGSKIAWKDSDLTITKAVFKNIAEEIFTPGSINVHGKRLIIGCKDSTDLQIIRLKPAGKNEMSAADFINGLAKN